MEGKSADLHAQRGQPGVIVRYISPAWTPWVRAGQISRCFAGSARAFLRRFSRRSGKADVFLHPDIWSGFCLNECWEIPQAGLVSNPPADTSLYTSL